MLCYNFLSTKINRNLKKQAFTYQHIISFHKALIEWVFVDINMSFMIPSYINIYHS